MGSKLFKGTVGDSLLLAVVRILTLVVGILSTMILSRKLSLAVYGTYTQGTTIISIGTSFSILGLTDSVNFFYNSKSGRDQRDYVNTSFMIQLILGGLVGLAILLFRHQICDYFQNPLLISLFLYIAFRPLFTNFIAMLNTLQVSIGQAKLSAFRSILLSGVKILLVLLIAFASAGIEILFAALLLVDLITIAYYSISFSKHAFWVNPFKGRGKLVREVLIYSLPMALCIIANSLIKDMDKLVIGYFEGTESMAIYANGAYALPIDIIANTFLVVVFPIITRYLSKKNFLSAQGLFSEYLRIGYLTTTVFSAGLLLVAQETVIFLFGEKYLSSTPVFMLYLLIDMIKFTHVTTILSAKGWTTRLMLIFVASLALNFVLNLLFYQLFGFNGPAIASVLVSLLTSAVLCILSAKAMDASFFSLLHKKELVWIAAQLIGVAIPEILARNLLRKLGLPSIAILLLIGGSYVVTILLINRRRLTNAFRSINQYK